MRERNKQRNHLPPIHNNLTTIQAHPPPNLLASTCTIPPPLQYNSSGPCELNILKLSPIRKSPKSLLQFTQKNLHISLIINLLLPSKHISSISDMGPIVLTQIATGLGVLAGAALLKSVMDQNPMMGPGSGSGEFTRCSSCNGTGRVTCLCNRWSDGDRGCRTCAGSGRMACNSCGGSGTGRPLPVQISVRPPNQRY